MKTIPKIRTACLLTAWALLALYSSISWAITYGVKYTKHNLGSVQHGSGSQFYSADPDSTEVCIFCHIPHNANTSGGKKFLWNRSDPAHTFSLYTSSPTLNYNKTGIQISEVSKMCMSCHDGVTALNVLFDGRLIDNQGTYAPVTFFQEFPLPYVIGADNFPDTTDTGSNLTNDHPISFSYQSAIDGGDTTLKPVAQLDLPLWNGKVECVTCHDPHINYNPLLGGDVSLDPFLRKTTNSSSLCFTCHDK